MKKRILMSLILVLLLSGCREEREPLAYFDADAAPARMIRAGEYWVSLMGGYGSADYALSVSDDPQTPETVCAMEDVQIWFLASDGRYAAWCERSGTGYTYRICELETRAVQTVFRTGAEDGYQLSNVGVHDGLVYYAHMDHGAQRAAILRFDPDSGQTGTVLEFPYTGEMSIMCFSVEEGVLSAAAPGGITLVRLEDDKVLLERKLPEDVRYVFGISYDSQHGYFGLYYGDADSEDIGIIGREERAIRSILTYAPDHYAYRDTIRCTGGRLYWISQANVTGYVTDHYELVTYDYLHDVYTEISRTFDFHADGDALWYLRYDRDGEYEGVELWAR